jgi:hypothetical protein
MPPLPRSLLSLSHTAVGHWARRCPTPFVSRCARVARARRCPSGPEPPRLCRADPRGAAPHPPSPLLLLPSHGTEPTPTPSLPCLAPPPLKREPPAAAALSSLFLSLALLRPWPSEPASCPCRRSSHRGPPRCVFDRRRHCFPPPR